jgi:Xaa-Pro aminopeptidase
MLNFETLTYVPFDTQLVIKDMLSGEERAWLNHYHQRCVEMLCPQLSQEARDWLKVACQAI